MKSKSRRYLWMIIFLQFLITVWYIPQAQSVLDIVVDGDFRDISLFHWSYDNQHFTFLRHTFVDNVPLSKWQEFDIVTQTLINIDDMWPLQPNLTAKEEAAFEPLDYILASPDSQLLALGSASIRHVIIANRNTMEFVDTQILAANPDFIGSAVYWSEDGTAFVYNRGAEFIPQPFVYYVHIPDSTDLSSATIIHSGDILINDIHYHMGGEIETSDRLYDVSSDGQQVILSLRRTPTEPDYSPQYPELFTWSPNQPSDSILVEPFDVQEICNVSFAPNSLDVKIVVLLSDGQMYLYDLENLTIKQLAIQLDDMDDCRDTGSTVVTAFSHDGAWLAYNNKRSRQLAFLDITQLINTNTSDTGD